MDHAQDPPAENPTAAAAPRRRGLNLTVAALLMLVCCCAAAFQVYKSYATSDPIDHWAWQLGWGGAEDKEIAASQLGQIGIERPGRALLALAGGLRDGRPAVRSASARALAQLALAARQAQKPLDAPDRATILQELIRTLKEDRDPSARAAAAESLGMIVPEGGEADRAGPAVAALTAACSDPDPAVRSQATVALGLWWGGGEPPPALIAALKDADPGTRAGAASALTKMEITPRLYGPLGAAIRDEELGTRSFAGQALASAARSDPRAYDLLFRALLDPNVAVRTSAELNVDGLRPPADALPLLLEGLAFPDPETRLLSAKGLIGLGRAGAPAVPALIRALDEHKPADEKPRKAPLAQASPGGGGGGGPGGGDGPVLIGPRKGIYVAAIGVVAPGSDHDRAALDALLALWPDAVGELRGMLAQALSGFGTEAKSAVPQIIELLSSSGATDAGLPLARMMAADALGRIAPGTDQAPAAVAALTAALKDAPPPLRAECAAALARFGDAAKSALPALRSLTSERPGRGARQAARAVADAIQAIEGLKEAAGSQ